MCDEVEVPNMLRSLDHKRIIFLDDVDTRGRFGFGPVHYIVEGMCDLTSVPTPDSAEAFGLTLDVLVEMNFSVDSGSEPMGMTPLAVAAVRQNAFVCRLLIDTGASVRRAHRCIEFRIADGSVCAIDGQHAIDLLQSTCAENSTSLTET